MQMGRDKRMTDSPGIMGLGGTYAYHLAINKGLGLPRLFLLANDETNLGHNSLEISNLLHAILDEQYEAFANGMGDPPWLFTHLLKKALQERDHRWLTVWVNFYEIHQKTIIEWVGEGMQGLPKLPHECSEVLKEYGWAFIGTSVREIYKKYHTAIKIALDAEGIEQNFSEAKFLERHHGIHFAQGYDTAGDGALHKFALGIPELYAWDLNYLWITRFYIDAQPGITIPDGLFRCVQNTARTDFSLDDIRRENLMWDPDLSLVWLTDCGSRAPYY